MNGLKPSLRAALAVMLAVGATAMAAPPPTRAVANQSSASQNDVKAKVALVPVYKPPLRGAPGGRVGGGTRGPRGTPARDIFVLAVLAPDHTGLTVTEQPSLFWFISAPTSLPVELTISDPRSTEPLLETRLPAAVEPGVHRARLADFGVRLEPGVPYQWSVTVVPDPARRSRDILASGTIERIEPSHDLQSVRATAPNLDLVRIYAENGIWYDAIETVSELVESNPADQTARSYRAALLQQAGLSEVTDR
jgi:hypothetical protein